MGTTLRAAPASASPSRVASFATTDVDEAARIGSELYFHHRLVPLEPNDFAYETTAGTIGSVTIGESSFGGPVRLEIAGQDDLYLVSIPDLSTLDVTIGSRTHTATPESAVVVGPVGDLRGAGWHEEGERSPILRFERLALEAELGRLLGAEVSSGIRFSMSMDVRSGSGAQWAALARSVIGSLHTPDALVLNPMLAAQMSSLLMTGLLLAADHPYRAAIDGAPRAAAPALIRRGADYIEAHAHDPLTVPGIAAELGISTRALQRGFSEHLSTTPSRYLTRVRMERAHGELVNGSPDSATVAGIASTWGFFHTGRFAAQYRTRYGASPSATLRGR